MPNLWTQPSDEILSTPASGSFFFFPLRLPWAGHIFQAGQVHTMCLNNAQYSHHSLQMSAEHHQVQISKASKDHKSSKYLESLRKLIIHTILAHFLKYLSKLMKIKSLTSMFLPFCVRDSLENTYLLGSDQQPTNRQKSPSHLRLGRLGWGLGSIRILYKKNRPHDAPWKRHNLPAKYRYTYPLVK